MVTVGLCVNWSLYLVFLLKYQKKTKKSICLFVLYTCFTVLALIFTGYLIWCAKFCPKYSDGYIKPNIWSSVPNAFRNKNYNLIRNNGSEYEFPFSYTTEPDSLDLAYFKSYGNYPVGRFFTEFNSTLNANASYTIKEDSFSWKTFQISNGNYSSTLSYEQRSGTSQMFLFSNSPGITKMVIRNDLDPQISIQTANQSSVSMQKWQWQLFLVLAPLIMV